MINIKKLHEIIDVLSSEESPKNAGVAIQIIDGQMVLTSFTEDELKFIKISARDNIDILKDAQNKLSEQQHKIKVITKKISFTSLVDNIQCKELNINCQEDRK